jgi:mannose-6-phosphate isomerase
VTSPDIHPLKLRPHTVPKVWGGRELERILNRKLGGSGPIGEIWVGWDGQRVTNGRWRDQLLRDLVVRQREAFVGPALDSASYAAFPLLVKFLDARQNLSIQVHPGDEYARLHEGQPFGKSEMWYVVAAEPGAFIYQGLSHPSSPAELKSILETGSIVDHLARIEVKPGDIFINAPGTIHALGAGVVIFELQQSSDLTYRLYDWDRPATAAPRPLHFAQSIAVADYLPLSIHQVRPMRLAGPGPDRQFLGASEHYAAELWTIDRMEKVKAHQDRFELMTGLAGKTQIRIPGASSRKLTLAPGDTVLVPAGVDSYDLTPLADHARVIRSYVPDLSNDVIGPLRTSNVADDDIGQLGGDPRTSALSALLAHDKAERE